MVQPGRYRLTGFVEEGGEWGSKEGVAGGGECVLVGVDVANLSFAGSVRCGWMLGIVVVEVVPRGPSIV